MLLSIGMMMLMMYEACQMLFMIVYIICMA